MLVCTECGGGEAFTIYATTINTNYYYFNLLLLPLLLTLLLSCWSAQIVEEAKRIQLKSAIAIDRTTKLVNDMEVMGAEANLVRVRECLGMLAHPETCVDIRCSISNRSSTSTSTITSRIHRVP